jgi:hypothetical protein
MEAIETLQELDEQFSETMLYEFADAECAPGNRLIVEHLKRKGYKKKQIEVLRSVIRMDTRKNGW